MQRAIFLDRDGVIIENCANYVRSWEDVIILSQAVSALSSLRTSSYKIILVTNQSAVGRGIISLQTAQAINHRLVRELEERGCRIDAVFMCPHAPEDQCTCRKPKPGLILQAAQAFALDLAQSVMIGDAWSDMQAGFAAGICTNVLVQTGRGQEQLLLPKPAGIGPVLVYATVADALKALIDIT